MAYSNNETQFSHTWIWTANVHNNMDESPNHYGEWKRSNTKTTYCEILEYDSLKETSLISPGREHTRAYLGLWRKEGIHEEGHSRVARFSKKNTGCPLKFEFQIKSGFFFFFFLLCLKYYMKHTYFFKFWASWDLAVVMEMF